MSGILLCYWVHIFLSLCSVKFVLSGIKYNHLQSSVHSFLKQAFESIQTAFHTVALTISEALFEVKG